MPPKDEARRSRKTDGPVESAKPAISTAPSPETQRTETHVTNRSGVVPIYRAIAAELERLFLATGAPQEKAAEFIGLPDRYIAKMFNPDSASGKQPSWPTVQRFVDFVASDGVTVKIIARPGPIFDALSRKFEMRFDKALANPRTRRQLLAEWGRRGGLKQRELSKDQRAKIGKRLNRARNLKLSKGKRSELAARAARARWLRHRERQKNGGQS